MGRRNEFTDVAILLMHDEPNLDTSTTAFVDQCESLNVDAAALAQEIQRQRFLQQIAVPTDKSGASLP